MTNRGKAITLFCAVFLISLTPATIQTVNFASDARGLVIIASLPSNEWSLNPYSNDCMFLSPTAAVWILKNLDYPYQRCSPELREGACKVPLISWVGRTLNNQHQDRERGYELLNYFIQRGEPLNAKSPLNAGYGGLTPIHEAILANNPKYLDVLLKAVANPLVKSDADRKRDADVDAYEFLAHLDLKHPKDREEVHKVLDHYRPSVSNNKTSNLSFKRDDALTRTAL